MAFSKKTWVDRAVEFAGRRLLTAVAGIADTFTVTRAEGTEFVVGDQINATNLNDLETRISDEFIALNNELIGINGTVLWTNPSPTSSFGAQSVTLSETIANFSEYDIEFIFSTSITQHFRTSRIGTAFSTLLTCNTEYMYYRGTGIPSGTSLQFVSATKVTSYGGSTLTDNAFIIPYRVVGYK